jgi:hypothetical protein
MEGRLETLTGKAGEGLVTKYTMRKVKVIKE